MRMSAYEAHFRGAKDTVLKMHMLFPDYDNGQRVLYEGGDDDVYILHIAGTCVCDAKRDETQPVVDVMTGDVLVPAKGEQDRCSVVLTVNSMDFLSRFFSFEMQLYERVDEELPAERFICVKDGVVAKRECSPHHVPFDF